MAVRRNQCVHRYHISGIGQAWVLSRHFPERGQRAIASALGWLIGGLLSQRLLAMLIPDISPTLNLFVFPIITGAVMGIPQWWVLRRYLPQVGWWWLVCPGHRHGRSLAYLDLGDENGRPLFFFHGSPGSRVEAIALHEPTKQHGYRLIAPDRPGMGASDPHRRLPGQC